MSEPTEKANRPPAAATASIASGDGHRLINPRRSEPDESCVSHSLPLVSCMSLTDALKVHWFDWWGDLS